MNQKRILQSRFRGEMLNLKEKSWGRGNKEHGKWSEKWKHPRLTRSKYAQVGRNEREREKSQTEKEGEIQRNVMVPNIFSLHSYASLYLCQSCNAYKCFKDKVEQFIYCK